MKNWEILILIVICGLFIQWQGVQNINPTEAYKSGEYLKYVLRYGWIEGGEASITINETVYNGNYVYYAKCVARSTGISDNLFKVRDVYECYMKKETGLPIKAIRNIRESSYKYYDEMFFNREAGTVVSQRSGVHKVPPKIMDLVGAFYYARSTQFYNLKKEDIVTINTFFEDTIYPLEIRYKGLEKIKTRFGTFECLKFNPVVEPGRIFDTEDDLKIWVSNDKNFIPLLVQFDLMIGSLKCELVDFSGLKNSSVIKKE